MKTRILVSIDFADPWGATDQHAFQGCGMEWSGSVGASALRALKLFSKTFRSNLGLRSLDGITQQSLHSEGTGNGQTNGPDTSVEAAGNVLEHGGGHGPPQHVEGYPLRLGAEWADQRDPLGQRLPVRSPPVGRLAHGAHDRLQPEDGMSHLLLIGHDSDSEMADTAGQPTLCRACAATNKWVPAKRLMKRYEVD
jgi:hypothetical protein